MNDQLPKFTAVFTVSCLISMTGCDRLTKSHAIPARQANPIAITGDLAMNQQPAWNDEARENLRATLRSRILGELRLAKNSHEDILQTCREVYIEDDCPEDEQATFIQFADDEFQRVKNQLDTEKLAWPAETDCDRLDRVEAALRDRGIILWQVSPCCDTCTRGEMPDRVAVISDHNPGFPDRFRGYAFFIDQNMPEMLGDSTELSVYLGYGWASFEQSDISDETYEKNALGIAREVCECLRNEGLKVDWNGELSQKIGLSLNWQRRDMLK